ncbi:MAG: hypothetical protein ACOCQT_00990, partial [Desulfovermiculus sp.]
RCFRERIMARCALIHSSALPLANLKYLFALKRAKRKRKLSGLIKEETIIELEQGGEELFAP